MRCIRSHHFKKIFIYLLPKHVLTRFAGCLANVKNETIKNYLIQRFIRVYNVNMAEAREENPKNYKSFNDFFIRSIKLEKRPTAQTKIVSPVDGCISEIGRITNGKMIQAKGHDYTVHKLLAGDKISAQFEQGQFATLYLSPKDYHRVHMPMDATLKRMTYVPGKLFSVQPSTAQTIPNLFARNERLIAFFDTEVGPMAMVLVGATVVGAIGTSWHGDIKRSRQIKSFEYSSTSPFTFLRQREEMGYFKLGSTVILLFSDSSRMQWLTGLNPGQSIRLGSALGDAVNPL